MKLIINIYEYKSIILNLNYIRWKIANIIFVQSDP